MELGYHLFIEFSRNAAQKLRLWRARRRHHHIDAVLAPSGPRWTLEYLRDDRSMVARDFSDEREARDDAAARLTDLQRAGWVVHW
jgi:hypothetical protein